MKELERAMSGKDTVQRTPTAWTCPTAWTRPTGLDTLYSLDTPHSLDTLYSLDMPHRQDTPQRLDTPLSLDMLYCLHMPHRLETPYSLDTTHSLDTPHSIDMPHSLDTPHSWALWRSTEPYQILLELEPRGEKTVTWKSYLTPDKAQCVAETEHRANHPGNIIHTVKYDGGSTLLSYSGLLLRLNFRSLLVFQNFVL